MTKCDFDLRQPRERPQMQELNEWIITQKTLRQPPASYLEINKHAYADTSHLHHHHHSPRWITSIFIWFVDDACWLSRHVSFSCDGTLFDMIPIVPLMKQAKNYNLISTNSQGNLPFQHLTLAKLLIAGGFIRFWCKRIDRISDFPA